MVIFNAVGIILLIAMIIGFIKILFKIAIRLALFGIGAMAIVSVLYFIFQVIPRLLHI